MQHSRGLVRVASGVVVFGLLVAAVGCGDKTVGQSNEGAQCKLGEKKCVKNIMRVCNPSQSGWNEFECASADSCLKGLPYEMCDEARSDAGVTECPAPTADCNSNMADGCESNLGTSVKNCGACGSECASTNGIPRCTAGQCHIDCTKGYADCNGKPDDGCEVSLSTDGENCGACGDRCSDVNGKSTCSSGVCAVSSCNTGYGDCDRNALNGCETVLLSDPKNCGICNQTCVNAHGTSSCVAAQCIPTCDSSFADCDGNPTNGCETDTRSTAAHCGACGNVCAGGSRAACVSAVCSLVCETGKGDCDGDRSNGCETDTSANALNCGACGSRCVDTNGTAICSSGACTISTCAAGYGNCDGVASNGCEVITQTNPDHCGGCNLTCRNAHGSVACTTGRCEPTCEAGFADCDGSPANGCETDTRSTTVHCGACGKVCDGGARAVCITGLCDLACEAGKGDCDRLSSNGCETDTLTSPLNCAVCGKACANAHGTSTCTAGTCVPTCIAGYADCDGNAANGCETATDTSMDNCGGCGKICSGKNGTAVCTSGSCTVTCAASYGDCDLSSTNGCEVYLPGDAKHCGSCSKVCTATGGTPSCSSGVCGTACDAVHANCDANAETGCEVDITTDKNNCGGCRNACGDANGTASCTNGACSLSCSVGFMDCDKTASNGCEIDLGSDGKNCGACGHSCLGGTCSLGICNPYTLATGQVKPTAIVADASGVYWLNLGSGTQDGAVMRLASGTSAPIALATGQQSPCDLAVTDTVFWTNQGAGSVMQVAKTGGSAIALVSGQGNPCKIAANSTGVVWADGTSIMRRAASGGSATAIAAATAITDLVIDSLYVYYANGTDLIRWVPLGGGTPTVFLDTGYSSSDSVAGIVLFGGSLCYTEINNDFVDCPSVVYSAGWSNSLPLGPIAADGNYFYWIENTSVKRSSSANPVVTQLATATLPTSIAVDDIGVYWTESATGSVRVIAKP